ncbi:hypothetical protein F4861DRAFT_525859 [Xylaria intraflava]|nr:hypothetical protein F4861DRAFT_525859 [Xylaria intraflava]
MAFNSFGNAGAANVSQGPALPEVHTEGLGFLSLAPDAKLRLVTPWLPPPSPNASLMSIASRRGLVAAAGPDAVVVASTDTVRKTLETLKEGNGGTQSFTPELKLPLSLRICQLAFSADEAYLVLSAEQGGGLAVYDVNGFQQGTTQPAFEIPTNGECLRALVPNPDEKSELCAVVTDKGKLLVANFKERGFTSNGNSHILKEQVSCVAWSNKGKQLVAGLGDGGMCQLTPEGNVKAEIPRPPGVDSSYYVASVVWLENDLFLVFHVCSSDGLQTKCHLITRQSQNFQFQALNDPVAPYAPGKISHPTSLRLRDFPPNLQDLLILSSNAVPDTGLIGRSKTPLAPGGPVDIFANIELADDSKRATLPISEDAETLDSPAAIGVSLDLSSKDKVYKPIPTDELDQSPGPLPGYWVLNEQGILSAWWVVYSESIRGGTTYPGLAVVKANTTESAPTQVRPTTQSGPFGAPSSSAFSSPSAKPTFGGPSALGASSSPWGTPSASTNGTGGAAGSLKPAFGSSTFGTSSLAPAGPAFGQSTSLGARVSPWGSGGASASTPAFGQVGFANTPNGTSGSFASAASSTTVSGGFTSFASQKGFAALGTNSNADKPSIFASTSSSFADTAMDTDTNTSFPPASSKPNVNTNNPFGSQAFKLTSSFKRDPNQEDDDGKDSAGTKISMFNSAFAASINEPTKAASNGFAGGQTFGQLTSNTNVDSTTPTTTPSANKFIAQEPSIPANRGPFSLPSTSYGGLFGRVTSKTSNVETPPSHGAAPAEAPLAPESTNNANVGLKSTAEDLPLPPDSPLTENKEETAAPTKEPAKSSAAPLPPDPVKNKAAYSVPLPPLPGESAKPVAMNDVPLPPDPMKNKKAYAAKLPPLPGVLTEIESSGESSQGPVKQLKAQENKLATSPIVKPSAPIAGPGFKFPTELPPISDSENDDLSDEGTTEAVSEGSGVDVAKDLSPSSAGANRTPGFTPQGSFDEGLGGSFSTIPRPEPDRRGFLFGQNVPTFPQPNAVSPRSPSPMRGAISRSLSNDQTRGSGAPGMASRILAASKKQPKARPNSSIVSRDVALENAVMEQQRKAKAKKQAEEAQLLLDEDDDAVQKILTTEAKPTLDLHEFIAHSGVAPPAGDNVPAQVEAVYRDINSMIDTLGLNSRSLQGWINGHTEFSSGNRSKQDLAVPDGWTLEDTEQLTYIVDQVLGEALDEARVTEVEEKVAQVQDIQRELSRDCTKQADIRKIIASQLDPEQKAAYQALPLSAEQAAQQSDLRRQLSRFQTLLAQAEEDLTLLKAKVVSASSANGRGGPVPTVDAIVRTITKMTNMVEKRSGDIDVLENQMRKMRLGSTGPTASREGSPFTTPNAKRTLNSSIFSPDRSIREATATPMRASLMRNSLSGSILGGLSGADAFRTPPRKKLSGFADTERKAVKEKRDKRTAILGKLRNSIAVKGPTVIPMDDIA